MVLACAHNFAPEELVNRLVAAGLAALLVVPQYLIVWHGDALEIDRHAISVAVELRIALWMITAMALDAVARARRPAAGAMVNLVSDQ